jgi:subfamily B ATP-binding cassette protein MsbA
VSDPPPPAAETAGDETRRPGKLSRQWAPIKRTLPLFRPYLGLYSLVVIFTLLGAAAEGGQAALIQPLLNRVLLRGISDEDEALDRDWIAARPATPAAVDSAAARAEAEATPATWDDREGSLLDYSGRRAQPGWSADALCQLLGRSKRQLREVEELLREDEGSGDQAWTSLSRGLLLQLEAQAIAGADPLTASEAQRALAGSISLRARDAARDASFLAAWVTLEWILLAALGLAVALGVSRFVSTAVSRVVVARIFRDVQNQIIARIVTLSAGQLLDARRGDLISRMTQDLSRAVNGVIRPLYSQLILQPLRLLALYLVALWVSWPLALGLLLLGLSVLYPIRRWGKLIRRSARRRQGAMAEVVEALHQLFGGMRVVKAFRREAHEHERFCARTKEAYDAEILVIRARITSRTWLRLVNDITIPVTILIGGWLIANGVFGLDVGQFAAFTGLTVFMYRPTRSLAMAYNMLQDNLVSLSRVLEVLDLQPEVVDAADATPLDDVREAIHFEGVGFSYVPGTPVLQDVSFTSPVGTVTAIVGQTGAGKSTLMDLILRFLEPTEGTIRIDDRPLQGISVDSWRSQLALVSQHAFLFNSSVADNLRYGRLDATQEELEAAAKQARIHDEIMAKPEGYDYLVGEHGSKLSGGQVQRLTLARAILRRPRVLLLDEATSALDTQTERKIQEAIASLEGGCTSFVIAHRLSTVRHADQILVLDKGRLVERGRHDELLEQGGVYANLVHTLVGEDD